MKHNRLVVAIAVASIGAICMLALATGNVRFYEIVVRDNNRLRSPIRIMTRSTDEVSLADGRHIKFIVPLDSGAMRALSQSDVEVDVESMGADLAWLYAKQKRTICLTSAPKIVVPLWKQEIDGYTRGFLTAGSVR